MGLVATLLPNPLRLARLRTALKDQYTVVTCSDWAELLRTCERQPVGIAVVDLYASGPVSTGFEWLRQLRRRFPSVTLALYVAVPPAQPKELFEAGRFGVESLIIADQDDVPVRLLGLIEQTEARGVLELVRREVVSVRPIVRDATLIAVTRAHQRLSPVTLARILGVRRRTLSERLAQAGFPTAQQLIAWARLIVAGRMLEDEERSADSIALALDFPSGSAFRNTCQRYLQATPQQIRANGGARFVIDSFMRGVRQTMATIELADREAEAQDADAGPEAEGELEGEIDAEIEAEGELDGEEELAGDGELAVDGEGAAAGSAADVDGADEPREPAA